VSRPVVRQALMRLQADGLVITRKGLGTIVQNTPPEGLTQFSQPSAVAHMLRCLELRMAVEGQVAALAATRHSAAELKRISKALDAMKASLSENGVATAEDFDFHLAVAAASGNSCSNRCCNHSTMPFAMA
jgi:DNA-binding FadR family transcriptional regulator